MGGEEETGEETKMKKILPRGLIDFNKARCALHLRPKPKMRASLNMPCLAVTECASPHHAMGLGVYL